MYEPKFDCGERVRVKGPESAMTLAGQFGYVESCRRSVCSQWEYDVYLDIGARYRYREGELESVPKISRDRDRPPSPATGACREYRVRDRVRLARDISCPGTCYKAGDVGQIAATTADLRHGGPYFVSFGTRTGCGAYAHSAWLTADDIEPAPEEATDPGHRVAEAASLVARAEAAAREMALHIDFPLAFCYAALRIESLCAEAAAKLRASAEEA